MLYRGVLSEARAGHVMVENTSGPWPDALERVSKSEALRRQLARRDRVWAATRTVDVGRLACRRP